MYTVSSASTAHTDNKYSVADILTSMGSGQTPQNSSPQYAPKYTLNGQTHVTPTLTPTTLNSIEQTFIELQNVPQNAERQFQSGFVPPAIGLSSDSGQDPDWSPAQKKLKTNSRTAVLTEADIYTPGYLSTSRKPPQRRKDDKINPEEAQRRLLRRERNKVAAAKCRQRRVDHTNILLAETDKLDGERNELENEIQSLQQQKEHLEFLLQAHRPLCKLQQNGQQVMTVTSEDIKVKVEPVEAAHSPYTAEEQLLEDTVPYTVSHYKSRPTSLALPLKTPTTSAQLGISITTPSSGILTFGLDSMVDGHTGLTPLTGIPSSANGKSPDLGSPTLMAL